MILSRPDWIPDIGTSSAIGWKPTQRSKVPETFRKRSRVFFHLTLGAYSSTTRHAGLQICAIPQMTQVKQLLDTWNVCMLKELHTPIADDNSIVEQQVNVLESELRSMGIINMALDCDLP